MKVLHVVPSFHPAHVYGGPTQSTYSLCRALARNGCEVRVLTTNANGRGAVLDVTTDREVEIDDGVRVRYCHRLGFESASLSLLRWLPSYLRWADVVHLMAVYSFPVIPTLMVCKLMRKPVVWSPRGMFQRWEGTTRPRSKDLWERVCWLVAPRRVAIHFTSEQEAESSAGRIPSVRGFVIPNGVDLPAGLRRKSRTDSLRLVYLGRLHPIKGIENLIEALPLLNGSMRVPVELRIGGNGEADYASALRAKVEEMSLTHRVSFVGEVRDQEKQSLLENADVVVVPSHTENFGMVVSEALAHGVPVIASKGTPWSRVTEVGCGLWVDNDPPSLAGAIDSISSLPLESMGERGREWMLREFGWDSIAREMTIEYGRFGYGAG